MQTGSLWTPKTCRFLVPRSSQSSILPGFSRNAALKPNCFVITVNPETHALDPLLWRVASCKLGSRWSRHLKTIQWDHPACPQRQQAPAESPHPTSTTSSNCLWGWALILWLLILVELDCRWDSKISVFLCTFSIWESRSCSPSPGDVRCVERAGQFQSWKNLHLRRNDLLEPQSPAKPDRWHCRGTREPMTLRDQGGASCAFFNFRTSLATWLTAPTSTSWVDRDQILTVSRGLRALCNHNVLHASYLYFYYLRILNLFLDSNSIPQYHPFPCCASKHPRLCLGMAPE